MSTGTDTSTAQSILGDGPPTTTGTSEYLGVPDNYAHQQPITPYTVSPFVTNQQPSAPEKAYGQQPQAPLYASGSEYTIASLPPEQIAQLQQAMVAVGIIAPTTKIRLGIADDATIAGYKQLLSFANINGTDVNGALQTLAANPQVDFSQTTPQLPNPDDEDSALFTAAQKLLGRNPTPTEVDDFRSFYNDAYTAGQTGVQSQTTTTPATPATLNSPTPGSAAAMRYAESYAPNQPAPSASTPPTIGRTPQLAPQAPSLDDAAENWLRGNDSLAVQGENFSNVMSMMRSIIDGSGGEIDFGSDRNAR